MDADKSSLSTKIEKYQGEIKEITDQTEDRMASLEAEIEQERIDRKAALKSELDPMQERLSTLNIGIETQMNDRTAAELTILASMKEGNEQIAEWLEQERQEREKQKEELYTHYEMSLKALDERKTKFTEETKADFDKKEEGIRKEVNDRFDEQNEIIEDLSEVIGVFQKTLRVVSDKENKD